MRLSDQSGDAFGELPDPGRAGSLDDLILRLRRLKVWAGDPSYEQITGRVNATWTAQGRPAGELAGRTTVLSCFRPGRRRLNADLVVAVVAALHPDVGYVAQWRQALQVIGGRTQAAAQVRVQDELPPDPAGFVGQAAELDRLRQVLHRATDGAGAVVVAGMAGVGKTQLAVHAGHLLLQRQAVDRVLFVNLRGFHPDPAQPPADPAAVLDGFLRLLGVPGQRVPHDLAARTAAYRDRLTGSRTLIVLDNAADVDQIRPLLSGTPGCPVLVTSRRTLAGLHPATHLALDVFTPDEARAFLLAPAVAARPVGADPHAPDRIARRCGHLPLALSLIAAHIRATPRWTLTDHADRLDELHHHRHLDTGVTLALDLSYQQLPAERQRLLRLAALHPGQDLDAHVAAALTDSDLPTAVAALERLYDDHLLHPVAPGRYGIHDLVRGYAASRAVDEDPPPARRAALTRLFDYYLATAATAVDVLYPAEARGRPRVSAPGTPAPDLAGPDDALAWLDTERPTLVAVAVHTATHGRPAHATRLSATLSRYLAGSHPDDALIVHGHADQAARAADDPSERAHVLARLGATEMLLARHERAVEHFRQALALSRPTGDPAGEARALTGLGVAEARLGRYAAAADHHQQALPLHRRAGDAAGETATLKFLGLAEVQRGNHRAAQDHFRRALTLSRQAGDRAGQADAMCGLGTVDLRQGRLEPAAEHFRQALARYRERGSRTGEAWALDGLGTVHTRLGRPDQATDHHRRSLAIFTGTGDRDGRSWALNGLGEAAHTAGRSDDAVTDHHAALALATDIGYRDQQARAHTGLGHAHLALGDPARARTHFQQALVLFTSLGAPGTGRIRTHLAAIGHAGATAR